MKAEKDYTSMVETLATGYYLRTIQTIVENVYAWLVGPRRHVFER